MDLAGRSSGQFKPMARILCLVYQLTFLNFKAYSVSLALFVVTSLTFTAESAYQSDGGSANTQI